MRLPTRLLTMLLPMQDTGARAARLAVMAYDIGQPRRARRVRRLLEAVHHAKQYSVFELRLPVGVLHGLLAEATALCNLDEDRLALWWPRDGLRFTWQPQAAAAQALANGGARVAGGDAALGGSGNFVVCYDISDAHVLQQVGGRIAARGVMLQRSVYWLRLPAARVAHLLAGCAALIQEDDRLWAYPLRHAGALWQVGESEAPPLLPIATHHWREAGA